MRHKVIWRSLTIVIVVGAAIAVRAAAQNPDPSKIDAIFAGVTDAKSPGLAVAMRLGGRTIFERGYGVRDLRTMAKIDAHTDFRLASFTKQFTAMSLMLLVHDGKLRYDEPLTDIFPDFPTYGRVITIRHLLTHTSGLPDYEDLMDAAEKANGPKWSATKQIQDAEVLELLQHAATPKFAAGTSWAYSNSAYVVLGMVVAKVSGEPFGQFLEQRIFKPLRMTHTLAYVNGKNTVPNRAYGHSRQNGVLTESDQSSTSATLGDGGVYSNLIDLAKWDEALARHTLLGEKEMAPALTPVTLANGSPTLWPPQPNGDNLAPGKPVSYGFGWFLDPYSGFARIWHTGSTSGFRTVIERFSEDYRIPGGRLTIIVLANRTDLDPAELALKAAGTVVVFPPPPVPATK